MTNDSDGCPDCGSQSIDWLGQVDDPIDGAMDRYSCLSCGNWWDEPEQPDNLWMFIDSEFELFAAFDLGAAAQSRYLEMTAA